MEGKGHAFKMAYIVAAMLVLLLGATSATYAWFSSNREVNTDRVSTKSGTEDVQLLISSNGGDPFLGTQEAGIVQVNKTSLTELMPVSTADLKNFVYNDSTIENMAVHFEKVEDEKYYYHGRVYLKAQATGQPENAKMKLYFDTEAQAGATLFKGANGTMANASRLGLTFEGQHPLIFRITDATNAEDDRANNTVIDGVTLDGNQVLDSASGAVRAAADPAQKFADYTVLENGLADTNTKSLLIMDLNRVYAVDIYFYIEGCDPDCTNSISFSEGDLHLAFYGILTKEAE